MLFCYRSWNWDGAGASAAAGWLRASHGTKVSVDLGLAEQIAIDSHFANRAWKPSIERHGADIQRRVAGRRRDAVLTHAARLQVVRLVPFDAIDPDVDAAYLRSVAAFGLGECLILAHYMEPLASLQQILIGLPVCGRAQASTRVEDIGAEPIVAVLRIGAGIHAGFPFTVRAVVRALTHPVNIAIAVRVRGC